MGANIIGYRGHPGGAVSVRSLIRLAGVALVVSAALAPPAHAGGWTRVLTDRFDAGGVPSHWQRYRGPYGSAPHNCAEPSHVYVWQGVLHLLMLHENSGPCGAGWYTGGAQVGRAYGSVDQRVMLRWRILSSGLHGHHVIPMRYPDGGSWPSGGEEDYCEGVGLYGCSTFLHYGASAPGSQIMRTNDLSFGLGAWHTMRFERREHVVKVWIDGLSTPVWVYRGTARTLPDTFKRVVLQQECRVGGCPAGTSGWEDIQIDWIAISDPS
jgi:hypothetical protein